MMNEKEVMTNAHYHDHRFGERARLPTDLPIDWKVNPTKERFPEEDNFYFALFLSYLSGSFVLGLFCIKTSQREDCNISQVSMFLLTSGILTVVFVGLKLTFLIMSWLRPCGSLCIRLSEDYRLGLMALVELAMLMYGTYVAIKLQVDGWTDKEPGDKSYCSKLVVELLLFVVIYSWTFVPVIFCFSICCMCIVIGAEILRLI